MKSDEQMKKKGVYFFKFRSRYACTGPPGYPYRLMLMTDWFGS